METTEHIPRGLSVASVNPSMWQKRQGLWTPSCTTIPHDHEEFQGISREFQGSQWNLVKIKAVTNLSRREEPQRPIRAWWVFISLVISLRKIAYLSSFTKLVYEWMNKIMSAIKDLTTQTQDVLCAEHSTGQIYFPLIFRSDQWYSLCKHKCQYLKSNFKDRNPNLEQISHEVNFPFSVNSSLISKSYTNNVRS